MPVGGGMGTRPSYRDSGPNESREAKGERTPARTSARRSGCGKAWIVRRERLIPSHVLLVKLPNIQPFLPYQSVHATTGSARTANASRQGGRRNHIAAKTMASSHRRWK